MRIRRCASHLLGSAAAAPPASCSFAEPPRFELPPPAPPAPAHESRPGFMAPEASSGGEPCCELSRSPWDLMDPLDLLDPEAEELFEETHFVSVTWRSSWLFLPSMPAFGFIKEEHGQEDMSDGVELHITAKKTARKKNVTKLFANKGVKVKKGVWTCSKNNGKGWFCRRLTREPNSYCSYHSDQKPKPLGSEKPHRKRLPVNVGEGFYYYAGFGPVTKRRRTSSSNSEPEPPLPAEPLKEEAPSEMQLDFSAGQVQANESDHQAVLPPAALNAGTAGISSDDDVPEPPLPAETPEEEALKEEAQSEMQLNSSAGQAQADGSDHQAVPVSVSVVDEPICNNGTVRIAGWDEESSDDDMLGCNGEQPRDITKRKSPFKKRWRKPVKARSLKSLML